MWVGETTFFDVNLVIESKCILKRSIIGLYHSLSTLFPSPIGLPVRINFSSRYPCQQFYILPA